MTDIGKDIKAVLDDRDRLIAEIANLKSQLPIGEALAIDAEDKPELARLHAVAAEIPTVTES